MDRPIVVLAASNTRLGEAVGGAIRSIGSACEVRSLDAPLNRGGAAGVSVTRSGVHWQGVELSEAGAVLVESPVFPWPQPRAVLSADDGAATLAPEVVARDREARALALSALHTVARVRPVINPPVAAHMAAAPAIALDRLAREGLATHAWRLIPRPESSEEHSVHLDAAGRERWHTPQEPPLGDPVLIPEPWSGAVSTALIVGGNAVAALHFEEPATWARMEVAEARIDDASRTPELAGRAAASLGLSIAAVSLLRSGASEEVLAVEAGPDLAAWDHALNGAVAQAIAEHLVGLSTQTSQEIRA